jgi:tripartite-type tricarboxylate transporter receptor subunit TctC
MKNNKSLMLPILFILLTVSMLFPITGVFAAADSYPSKAVRLIIPFAPGGSNDIVGRLIAAKLTERLGKSVVVENHGGAGGVLGTELASKADPDGYTLLIISAAYGFNPALSKSPFNPATAFAPIAKLGSGPVSLVVHPSVPAKSVKELIALAKQKRGQLICSCSGAGSLQHQAANRIFREEFQRSRLQALSYRIDAHCHRLRARQMLHDFSSVQLVRVAEFDAVLSQLRDSK